MSVAAPSAARLCLTGVSHRFAQQTVLRDVSTELHASELAALVGPSGSGKTTLLAIAGALLRPDAGTVCLDGLDLAEASEGERARCRAHRIAYVFQGANLPPFLPARALLVLNARLAGARTRDAHTRADTLLEAVGLPTHARTYPGRLSGGERQRLAVAAALVKRPAVLLADEPTAALDTDSGRGVLTLLGELARRQGAAVLVSTHDERMLDLCDRVLRLRDGSLT
jgi:putative ABC transport system ATP-binding protein